MSRLSRVEFAKQFQIHFKIHLRPEWIDPLLTSIQPGMKIHFDVLRFDDYLHQQFGEYENDDKSMASIIAEKFGEAASKLIQDHL